MKEIIYLNFSPKSERENVGKSSQDAVLICCVLVFDRSFLVFQIWL